MWSACVDTVWSGNGPRSDFRFSNASMITANELLLNDRFNPLFEDVVEEILPVPTRLSASPEANHCLLELGDSDRRFPKEEILDDGLLERIGSISADVSASNIKSLS